jgi:hypothetical protein
VFTSDVESLPDLATIDNDVDLKNGFRRASIGRRAGAVTMATSAAMRRRAGSMSRDLESELELYGPASLATAHHTAASRRSRGTENQSRCRDE